MYIYRYNRWKETGIEHVFIEYLNDWNLHEIWTLLQLVVFVVVAVVLGFQSHLYISSWRFIIAKEISG